jgi:hypothetical protein
MVISTRRPWLMMRGRSFASVDGERLLCGPLCVGRGCRDLSVVFGKTGHSIQACLRRTIRKPLPGPEGGEAGT